MLGPLVQAGAAALNYFGARDANKQNAANAAAQMQMQQEFAKNGIRWRVEDAKRSGIHPLFALGAQTTSYTPQQATFSNEFSGVSSHLAAMGQDISRAEQAGKTQPERDQAFANSMRSLQLENAGLDLEIKKATLASAVQRLKQTSQPPIPGGDQAFVVPENEKSEERPPLMYGGYRIMTPWNTSPMKAFSDQVGDEGPMNWLASMAVAAHMLKHNATHYLGRAWGDARGPVQSGPTRHIRVERR